MMRKGSDPQCTPGLLRVQCMVRRYADLRNQQEHLLFGTTAAVRIQCWGVMRSQPRMDHLQQEPDKLRKVHSRVTRRSGPRRTAA